MNENLINKLEKLNFNTVEAKVYITLVKFKELNGSQIAKKINASRSSVYSALNNLYSRGIVYLISGDTNIYRAENPETLIEKIKANFEETTATIKDELLLLEEEENDNNYYNLSGTNNFINKAKELLLNAEKEVYINTCIELDIFKDEFEVLIKKGVSIIVFTFNEGENPSLPVEIYRHKLEKNNEATSKIDEIRLMLVVDLKFTLICSTKDKNTEMTGTFTQNQLLANIVAEHIHNDIYLLKLKEKYNKELIDKDILIGSLLEKRLEGKASLRYRENNN